jgi:two-component system LytT family sensor kinase
LKSTSDFFLFLFHLIFWVALYLVPFVDPRGVHPVDKSLNPKFFFDIHLLINHAFFIFVFYFNSNYLIPKFLKKSRKIEYTIILSFLVILILSVSFMIFPSLRLPKPPTGAPRLPSINVLRLNQTIALAIPLLFVLMVSTTYRILRDKLLQDKINKEKETENLKTELSFLRSQISPHFIFNALNSSIILVRKQSDLAESCLLKLASLLRYMLYEADDDKVLIENEIQYISDYIDLQGIRFGESVVIQKHLEMYELLDQYIEPMLLIPFIENAFKHGTSVLNNPEIHISLKEEKGVLLLEVKNKFVTTVRDNKNNGIGLTNVGRRLELLYPNKHTLNLSIEKDWYSVFLSIDLTK